MEKTCLFDWIVTGLALFLPIIVYFEVTGSLVDQDSASGGPMRDAAYFPRILGWTVLFLALANAAKLMLTSSELTKRADQRPLVRNDLAVLTSAIFIVYLLLLPPIGYYFATPILLASLMYIFGVSLYRAVALAAVYTLVVAWVFEGLLNVILPLGWSEFTLFG